jgi:hypothetical protein
MRYSAKVALLKSESARRRGRAGQRVLREKRESSAVDSLRPPDEWTHLKTIVSHDRITNRIDQIDLFQGDRSNNYHVRSDGKEWLSVSATVLSVMLRKRWSLRWITD